MEEVKYVQGLDGTIILVRDNSYSESEPRGNFQGTVIKKGKWNYEVGHFSPSWSKTTDPESELPWWTPVTVIIASKKILSFSEKCAELDTDTLAEAYDILFETWKKEWPRVSKAAEMKSIFKGGTQPCTPFDSWVKCIDFLKKHVDSEK